MRRVADVRRRSGEIVRVMIHDEGGNATLFMYDSPRDGPSATEESFPSSQAAMAACRRRFGILPEDWKEIEDAREGCLPDWIAPRRFGADGCAR